VHQLGFKVLDIVDARCDREVCKLVLSIGLTEGKDTCFLFGRTVSEFQSDVLVIIYISQFVYATVQACCNKELQSFWCQYVQYSYATK
jgi:hypothetical protein